MRELSISLFRDVMETVVGNDKKRMKKKVRRGLIPLFLHMCDETDSVAKVEISKLASDTGRGVLTPRTSAPRAAGTRTLGACVISGSD